MTGRPFKIYAPGDRPDVEVLVDGQWLVGELRMWMPVGDEDWEAQVQYRPAGTTTRKLGKFPGDLDHVRPVDDEPLDRPS